MENKDIKHWLIANEEEIKIDADSVQLRLILQHLFNIIEKKDPVLWQWVIRRTMPKEIRKQLIVN